MKTEVSEMTLVGSRGMIGNRPFYAVHQVQDGTSLCGIDIAFAQKAGKYQITFPKVAPFKYQCTLCRRREIEQRAGQPQ